MKYSEELKRVAYERYASGTEPTEAIIRDLGIPRSTFYGWIKKMKPNNTDIDPNDFTLKNYKALLLKVRRLESMIEVLKQVSCSNHSPLKERLNEAEMLYSKYSVHLICEALDISRGTFYNHIFRNKRNNTWYAQRREILCEKIREVYDESFQRFGSNKIAAVLQNEGVSISPEMVRKLMREMGLGSIRGEAKKMFEKDEDRYRNRVQQHFDTDQPNVTWVSDVTYYKFKDKAYYICVIIDLFSRIVVGYHISYNNSSQLIRTTFRKAYTLRKPEPGLVFHSDRGTNYRSNALREYLASFGVVQSFSRAYVPYDNSVMESFFSNMKREELYRTKYRSEREFYDAVDKYIDFYNEKRPHQKLKYKTPSQYEAGFLCKIKDS